MRSVTLFLVVIGVVFATAAADARSSASAIADIVQLFFATEFEVRARVTRQDPNTCSEQQEQDVFNNLPAECSALNNSVPSFTNPDKFAGFFETFCKPECGNPLTSYIQQCLGHYGPNYVNYANLLCSQNSIGDYCYSSNVFTDVNVTQFNCLVINSPDCCQSVQSTVANTGCCINILDMGGLNNSTDLIESTCSINLPESCTGSTLGGTVPPTSSGTAAPNTCSELELQDVISSLPSECSSLRNTSDSTGNPNDELAATFETFCNPECGNPVIRYLQGCTGNDDYAYFANYYIQLCAKSSNGDFCYSTNVTSDVGVIGDACFVNHVGCCQSVQSTITNIGCCISILDIGGMHNQTDIIEMSCSINLPEICSESTLDGTAPHTTSGTAPPTTSGTAAPNCGILFGALAMLLTIMLQCLF